MATPGPAFLAMRPTEPNLHMSRAADDVRILMLKELYDDLSKSGLTEITDASNSGSDVNCSVGGNYGVLFCHMAFRSN